jgi:hypothetical protein
MHDEGVRKLRSVVEIDEELHWLNIAMEVFDIGISDFADVPSEAILIEPLHEKIMIMPNQLRHNINS